MGGCELSLWWEAIGGETEGRRQRRVWYEQRGMGEESKDALGDNTDICEYCKK